MAQTIETVGPRSLGMGGAFVAVANDSSAVWWNPGGLGAGPFLDVSLSRGASDRSDRMPAGRARASGFALTTPPFGVSYYRFRASDVRPAVPTAAAGGDRQDQRVGLHVRSITASQLGVTLVQTLLPGIHAGTTLKYVRGAFSSLHDNSGMDVSRLLDQAGRLEGGGGAFDLDAGVFAGVGAVSVGVVIRNVRETELVASGGAGLARLPRQVRGGVAFDGSRTGGAPLTLAADVDLRAYDTLGGARRVVALGAEHWVAGRRLGLRAGTRFNTAGGGERVATAGLTARIGPGVLVDGYVVGGRAEDARGWGLAARVSF